MASTLSFVVLKVRGFNRYFLEKMNIKFIFCIVKLFFEILDMFSVAFFFRLSIHLF